MNEISTGLIPVQAELPPRQQDALPEALPILNFFVGCGHGAMFKKSELERLSAICQGRITDQRAQLHIVPVPRRGILTPARPDTFRAVC